MSASLYSHLDVQIAKWSSRLQSLRIPESLCQSAVSEIAREVRSNIVPVFQYIIAEDHLTPRQRVDEITGFQKFHEYVADNRGVPALVRARVSYINYICFVYLKESLFEKIRSRFPKDSTIGRLMKPLLSDKCHLFRNAVAHGTWCYADDYKGLKFCDKNHKWEHFAEEEYDFLHHIASVVAFVVYLEAINHPNAVTWVNKTGIGLGVFG